MVIIPKEFLKKIFGVYIGAVEFVLDCLFPVSCAACHVTLTSAEKPNRLCSGCLGKIIIRRSPETSEGTKVYSPLDYRDPVGSGLIKRLKYDFDRGAALPLARFLIAHLKISGFINEIGPDTVIVPIPLHPARLHERGFNQAELLALLVGQHFSLPVYPKAVIRVRNTLPQSKLDGKKEKIKNISDCFSPGKEIAAIKGKTVILLDDIWTSGATMKEAASVIRHRGARKIIFVSATFAG